LPFLLTKCSEAELDAARFRFDPRRNWRLKKLKRQNPKTESHADRPAEVEVITAETRKTSSDDIGRVQEGVFVGKLNILRPKVEV